MAWQLVYTSAPRLLDAGRSGFGTVARHRDIPSMLVQSVERVSQFARLPGMNPDRVIYSHRIIQISSSRYHVLSMIRSAGSDYTGRTNHIAHHLIASDREAAECAAIGLTPADILCSYPWLSRWTEEAPRSLGAAEEVRLASVPAFALQYSVWDPLTENPAHAWLLVTHPSSRSCYVKAPTDTDFRLLFLESLRGFHSSSWQPTFITSLEPTDDASDFRWIGLDANSPSLATAESSGRPIFALTRPDTLPEPEIPQQSVPPPNVAVAPQVQPRRASPLPSVARMDAPFVEKDFESSFHEESSHTHPLHLRLKHKTDQGPRRTAEFSADSDDDGGDDGKPSTGSRSVVFAALAIIGAAMVLFGFWHQRNLSSPSSEKIVANEERSPAQQIKEEEMAQIKKLLGNDALFSTNVVNDIWNSHLDDGSLKKYCLYLKSLVEAYRQLKWDALPKTDMADPPAVLIVERLRKHIEKLNVICKHALPLDAKETYHTELVDLAKFIKQRVEDTIQERKDDCQQEYARFVRENGITVRSSEPENKTGAHIEEIVRGQLLDYLLKLPDNHEIHLNVDANSWANAIRQLSSIKDMIDSDKLVSIANKSSQKMYAADSPQLAPKPVSAPSRTATGKDNPVAAPKEKPTAKPVVGASGVRYIFCDELPEISLPHDLTFERDVSTIQFQTLSGSKSLQLPWRRARNDFGKDEEPWYKPEDGGRGRKLIPKDGAKSAVKSFPLFQITLSDIPARAYIIIGGEDDRPDKDKPILAPNSMPELTMDADHLLKGDLLSRIECNSESLQRGIRFNGALGSNLEKLGPKSFPVDASGKVDLQLLQQLVNSKLSHVSSPASQAERDLLSAIERDTKDQKELENALKDPKQNANAKVLGEQLEKTEKHLADNRQRLKDLKKDAAPQANSGEALQAANTLKGWFFDPSGHSKPGPSESPATLLLVAEGPAGRTELPLCDVKIQFK